MREYKIKVGEDLFKLSFMPLCEGTGGSHKHTDIKNTKGKAWLQLIIEIVCDWGNPCKCVNGYSIPRYSFNLRVKYTNT